ncbi:unnamed protein product [Microthlaspi erraticum]|uniref:Zinc knuckle CX2CX4HX4C domain-containing protein n=1 Tax=Microthlaspi erraticum TaxID=1685480 RepID=A0A6D2K616_9BRAS|nr:unnamed protein product [Microthlaspi erraticum]
METVLRRGPWAFADRMVVLQRWTPYMMAGLLDFIPFWVQIRGIPLQFMNQDVIAHIGRAMGLLMDVDYNAEAIARVQYARVRLNLDVTQPLRFQKNFQFTHGYNTLLRFRYERLRGFCEVCGMLTHDSGACLIQNGGPANHSDGDDNDEDTDSEEEHEDRDLPNGDLPEGNHHRNVAVEANGNPRQAGGVIIEEIQEDVEAFEDEESEAEGTVHSEEMEETEARDAKEEELRNAIVPTKESLKKKFEDDPSEVMRFQNMEGGQESGCNKKLAAGTERVSGEVGPEPPQAP